MYNIYILKLVTGEVVVCKGFWNGDVFHCSDDVFEVFYNNGFELKKFSYDVFRHLIDFSKKHIIYYEKVDKKHILYHLYYEKIKENE